MSLDTVRVSSTRVSSPPRGQAVLALSLHWGERLVAYEHVEPGTRGASGVRWVGEAAHVPVADGQRISVAPGEQVQAGLSSGLTLTARLRRRERGVPAVEPAPSEFFALRILACAVLGFAALVAMMVVTPVVEDDGPSFFRGDEPGPSAHFVVPVPTTGRVFDAARAPVDAGRLGKARSSHAEAPTTGRADRTDARAAVRSLLDQMMGGPSSQVLTAGLGGELSAALDGLTAPAASVASADGLGGLGSRGTGGGASTTGLGLGGLGTVGGPADLAAMGLLRGHGNVTIICRFPLATVTDGLSRAEVARVVKRHEAEIRYCYEAGLPKRPDLAGKLAVQWSIVESGEVASASVSESSLDAADVEACVLSRVRRWRFPPHQGSEVVVNFPWVFSVAGAATDDGS